MTTEIYFTKPLHLIFEGYQSTYRIGIERFGTGIPVSAKVTFTGATVASASKRQDRAVKSASSPISDFYASTQYVNWASEEEGIKYVEVEINEDNFGGEPPEYFYCTLNSDDADVLLNRTHCFIIDSPIEFFSEYINQPFSMKLQGLPEPSDIPVLSLLTDKFDYMFMEVNGEEYPASILPQPKYEQEKVNNLNYTRIGSSLLYFSGEYHLEELNHPMWNDIKNYNQYEGTQLSEYSALVILLPFTNDSNAPVPVSISNSQVWMFQRMGREEEDEQVNASLTGVILPNSNKVVLEYARGGWKTNLNFSRGEWNKHIKPSFRLNICGLLPNNTFGV
jgi:hypothetical protein